MNPASLTLILAIAALVAGSAGSALPNPPAPNRFGAYAASGASVDIMSPTPEPPTGLTVRAQTGSRLTLEWTPPSTGPVPTGYVLEGGFSPGEVLGSLPIGRAPTLTLDAPAGVFFVRLHAIAGADRSAASNEIQVFVNVPAPPSAPVNLLGMVDGASVMLSWTNTFSGGAPAQLWLEVSGTSPAVLPLPLGETFTYAGVPSGTYTLRVLAANASGTSAPSNAVTLTFPGACSGTPGRPTNFQAWTENAELHVSWNPPAGGPAVSSYVVHVSGTRRHGGDHRAHGLRRLATRRLRGERGRSQCLWDWPGRSSGA